MKIISVGEITIDRYLWQNLSLVGGISLNFAVNARRSGADVVSMVSCVGNGRLGRRALATLARERVDCSHIAVLAGETAEIDIQVNDIGERFFPAGGYRANVLSQLKITDDVREFVKRHDIVATQLNNEGPVNVVGELLVLKQHGLRFVVDYGEWDPARKRFADLDTLNAVDVAFISGDETTLPKVAALSRRVDCLVIATLGAAGSVALTPDGPVTQAALRVDNPVDSTGCGDSFQAAFTTSYFRDSDVRSALQRGAEQAARVLQHYGAFEQEAF